MRWMPRVAVLTLGIAAALTVAAPPSNAGPPPPLAPKLASADRTIVPADFRDVMGYEPQEAVLADGTVRLINPLGSCSVPGEGRPFDFDVPCQAHDFGYDLLRHAKRTGRSLPPSARTDIDALLTRDLHVQCRSDKTCDATVAVFQAGVAFNSWRQVLGPPVNESGLPRTAGLVLLAGAGSLGLLKRWRWRRARLAGSAG